MRIRLRGLCKRYGKVHALEDVSLTIGPGNIISIVGPNGAGKTTLLRCLAAVVRQSKGQIYFDDERFTRGAMALRQRIAFLPDFPIAFPDYTMLRHIGMVLRVYGKDDPAIEPRVMELLRDFDLLPVVDTPLARLSRGQAYKTALVALMAADPELLLLDEPFASGMDPNGITALKREARAAAQRGRTVAWGAPLFGGYWRGFERAPNAGYLTPAYAGFPVSYDEISKVMFKANAARILAWAPLMVAYATALQVRMGQQAISGVTVGIEIVLILLAAQPFLIAGHFSGGSNDSKDIRWHSIPLLVAAVTLFLMLVGGAVVLFIADAVAIKTLAVVGMWVASTAAWYGYKVLFNRGQVDLLSKPQA